MDDIVLYDLHTTRGATFDKDISFKSDSESLVGKTAQGQIRVKAGAAELAAAFTCTVSEDSGLIHLSLSSEQTLALNAGVYQYDVALIGGGKVEYYIGGQFIVRERVTEVTE